MKKETINTEEPEMTKPKKPVSEVKLAHLERARLAKKIKDDKKREDKIQEEKQLQEELEAFKQKQIEKKKKALENKAKKELEQKYKQELKLKQELQEAGVDLLSDDDLDSDDEIEAIPKPVIKKKTKPTPVIINNYVNEKTADLPKKNVPPKPAFLFL